MKDAKKQISFLEKRASVLVIFLLTIGLYAQEDSKDDWKKQIQSLEEEIQKDKAKLEKTEESIQKLKQKAGIESKDAPEKYVSPMKEKGLSPDFMRSMFLDPEHAKEVRGNKNFWLGDNFRVGVFIRPRLESRQNLDFNNSTDDYVNRALQSSQLWFLFDLNPYLSAKINFQDARVWGGSVSAPTGDRKYFLSNSGSTIDPTQKNNTVLPNSTDIREAFVQIKSPGFPIRAVIGRQVFAFGDQRMIGGANWNTNGLSYDGIKLSYESKIFDSHFFGAKMTAGANGPNGVLTAHGRKNGSIDDSYLVGNYNTIKLPYFLIDLYGFGILKKWIPSVPAYTGQSLVDEDISSPDRIRQNDNLITIGTRLTNRTENNFLPKSESWDWTIELATQMGYTGQRQYASWDMLKENTGYSHYSEKVKYSGKFIVFQTGYTFWQKFRLGGQFTQASGDQNRKDGTHSTFELLPNPRFGIFPYFDSIGGIAENIGMKNIKSYNISLNYQTNNFGLFTLNGFIHRKAVREDAWYAISGDPNTGSSGSCSVSSNPVASSTENCTGNAYSISKPMGVAIFNEIDLSWSYHWREGVSFWMGFSYLRAGDSIRNARTDPLNPNPYLRYNFLPNAYTSYFMVNMAI